MKRKNKKKTYYILRKLHI